MEFFVKIGHNLKTFDFHFLKTTIAKYGGTLEQDLQLLNIIIIDSYLLIKQLNENIFPNPLEKTENGNISFSQESIYNSLFGKKPRNSHTATGDVENLEKILNYPQIYSILLATTSTPSTTKRSRNEEFKSNKKKKLQESRTIQELLKFEDQPRENLNIWKEFPVVDEKKVSIALIRRQKLSNVNDLNFVLSPQAIILLKEQLQSKPNGKYLIKISNQNFPLSSLKIFEESTKLIQEIEEMEEEKNWFKNFNSNQNFDVFWKSKIYDDIIKCGANNLTLQDLKTLVNKRWLNDQIINCIFELIGIFFFFFFNFFLFFLFKNLIFF